MKTIIYTTSLMISFGLGYAISQYQDRHQAGQNPIYTPTTLQQPQNQAEQAITQEPLNQQKDTLHPQRSVPSTPSKKLDVSGLFNQLLLQGEYSEAMSLYSTIYSLSTDESKSLKTLLLTHLYQLINKPHINYEKIIAASDAYLNDFYNDVEVLLIQAQLYSVTDNAYEALNIIQLANSYAITPTAIGDIEKAYQQLMTLNHETYAKSQDWDSLIYIYQLAENTGLLNNNDKLRLLEIHLLLGDINEAKALVEELKETYWAEQVVGLFEKYNIPKQSDSKPDIENAIEDDQYSSVIPVIKRHNQFIVPLTLSGLSTQLLLDTGASLTTISQDYYRSIASTANLRYKDKQQFLTANGKTTGNIYRIDKITIGGHTIYDTDIAVLDFHTPDDSHGLLGMNILGQFRFTIDQENAKLKLSPKE